MVLQTERLILRKPEPTDVGDYLEFRNSEFVLRYNAMKTLTRDQAEKEFASAKEGENLVLEEKSTGKIIGMICIGEDSLRWGVASREISYFMHEGYARRGYMKEALQSVINDLFEKENLECVAARAFAPNTASIALLRSLGFRQDGLIPRCVKGYADVVYDDTLHSLFRK